MENSNKILDGTSNKTSATKLKGNLKGRSNFSIDSFLNFKTLIVALALHVVSVGNVLGQCGPFQIYESFGTNALPTQGGTWVATSMTYLGTPRTGVYAAQFDAVNDAIRMPQIANPGVLSFWHRRNTNTTAWTLNIQTSPDGSTWTTRGTVSFNAGAGSTTYAQYTLNIGALGLTNVHIRLIDARASGTNARFIDDLSITSTVASNNTILIQGQSCTPTLTAGVTYTIYDRGGVNDRYSNNQTTAPMVLTPPVGYGATLNFTTLATEDTYDFLRLYNGNSTSSTAFHAGSGWSGATAPGSFTASNASNSLTVDFISDNTNAANGFVGTLTIALLPTCSSLPSALTASITSVTTATLAWTAASPAPGSGYEIYYSTSSTTPVAGTAATTTTAAGVVTKNITGLTANTSYYWWVRSNCNGTDKGSWVSGGTFYTGYCVYSITNSDATGITSVAFNTINNTTTGDPAYSDFTAQTTSVSQGSSYSLIVKVNTDGAWTVNTKAWIDWNQNLVFEAGEEYNLGNAYNVANGNTSLSPLTINVPVSASIGNTRMRIVAAENSNPTPVACGTQLYGEAEDYILIVSAPCSAPSIQASSITASSISNSSASIGWTNGNGASRVVYVNTTNSFTSPTNGTNSTANTVYASGQQCIFNGSTSGPITVSGLAANTTYWVRVYEYCTSGNTYQTATATGNSNSFTTSASCVVTGNPATYGNGAWIGYVYNSATAGGFDSYQGFVTESEQFNRTHATIADGASSSHCSLNTDLFAIRYKMTKNFTAGYYTFTVGGDDGVRLSLDGGASWHISNWVDQGYTTSTSSNTVYLSGNTNLVFEYYENSGGSQSSFSYTYSADPLVPSTGNNSYTLCSGTLYDHAGPSANYVNNVSGYTVLYPGVAGNFIRVSGTSGGETCCDWIRIYNGVGLGGTLLWSGNPGAGTIPLTTSTSGPLTVQFTSDVSSVGTGFALNVVCVGPPAISSISASPACQGATVTLTGSGFTGVTGVTFNGVAAASYTVNSETSISAVVPVNGTSGNVIVTNSLGSGSFALTVNSSPVAPTLNAVTTSFCGAGGTTAITASGSTGSYAWTALEGNPSLSNTTGTTINATLTQTSAIQVVGTGGSCPSLPAFISIGVYPLPGATMASTPNSFCLGTGTAVNVTSGLAAGNFSSVAITHAPKTAPASATTLVGGGIINVIPDLSYGYAGDVDDAGWSGIPVGFTYDFFGTPYTTMSVGTNGNVFFGAAPNVTDFTFTTLPSASEPFNMVAVLAMDNEILSGAIKYWTEGYAPNRRFVVSYEDVKEYGDTKYSTAQAIFYETTGVIEVHVTSSTNADRVKVVGVNNGDGTIGVQALNVTAAITTPVAYRFTPPANYTTQWYANGVALGSAGTNVFALTGLTPTATTTYSIDYTNQTTGCSNDPANASVPVTVNTLTLATTPTNADFIWRGATSTDWNTASNWFTHNGTTYALATAVPTSTNRAIIPANQSCVLAQPAVNITTAGDVKDVIIEAGATLTMTTGTLNVNGNFVNNGTFVAGTGKVVFNTAGTVSGNATTFNDVDLNNGVNFGSNLSTVNGIMTMNNGSWVNTNAPIYGTSSLLKYNTGGTYGRGFEWSTTSGAGYPNDVQISNNTTINYPNTGGSFSTNLGVRRDLTIDAGSNVYMDYGTGNASGSLTVGRHVTMDGDLSLGNQIGGDLSVGGNWTHSTGNLYANNRAVFFNGATGNQSITKSGGETFPYMVVNKASGTVVLNNNVTVTGGLTLTNGLVVLGANDLILGSATLTGGSSSSYVKTASTGVVKRNVGATATAFPVGNSSYNPAILTNAGTADVFSLKVLDNVTTDGTGVGTTTTEAVVNRTWMLEEATFGGSNVTLRLYWNGSGEEINTFSPSTAFMAHYMSAAGMWDNIGGTIGAGYVESTGITSFSPFSISSSSTFAPLPVELLSLDAQCAGENVIVSWKTASEHNSLNYIVERSENGTSWTEIQTVGAAGNSNTVLEYAIEDAGAARGVNYYRLIQTDQDGVQKIYGPVMSNCGSEDIAFMSFPNPSDADITLVFNNKNINGSTTLTVRDAHGRVVRSMALEIQPGTTSILIPDLELTSGVYYLQLEGDNFTSPVIKHSLR